MSRHYIISYDISDNALRLKMSKLLLRHGCERLQKSVFIAANIEKKDLMTLKADALALMQAHSARLPTDSLLCFPIHRQDIDEMVWEGNTAELRRLMEELRFILI